MTNPTILANAIVGLCLATAVASIATPAAAVPYCTDTRPGVSIGFGFGPGKLSREEEESRFYIMELRREGIDATRVERWNGCLRAFVRQADGTEVMRYFHPSTLEETF